MFISNTKTSVIEKPEEFLPTVPSQSYIHTIWDFVSKINTTTAAVDQNTAAKPFSGISADHSYHENHPAALPIGTPRMAGDDLIIAPTLLDSSFQFMPAFSNHPQQWLVKDDVFLAQPTNLLPRDVLLYPSSYDQDDNASLSSHSSVSSSNHDSQHSDCTIIKPAAVAAAASSAASASSPPCLSPVTSPTNFLYNNEPLFDGLGDRILLPDQEQQNDTDFDEDDDDDDDDEIDDDEEDDDISIIYNRRFQKKKKKDLIKRSRRLSTSSGGDDLDWYKLLDAFHADVACDLVQSGSETDEDALYPSISNSSVSSSEDEFDDDDFGLVVGLKRKRAETPVNEQKLYNEEEEEEEKEEEEDHEQQESDDDDDEEEEEQVVVQKTTRMRNQPRQKRRRKSKATSFTPRYRKYQKKKTGNNEKISGINMTVTNTTATTTTTTITNNKKNQNEDKKKKEKEKTSEADTPTHGQLIESLSDEEESDNTTTVFQHLTESGIDWCRYCGTTEGVNWRPGPWGKRTLCNKHGCDYKGYGLASRLPRLDLSAFVNENLKDRLRPVVQQFCILCQSPQETEDDKLILCDGGCSRAYHQQCHSPAIHVNKDTVRWYCSALCKENRKRNKVVVELPRKHMPLMQLLFKPL